MRFQILGPLRVQIHNRPIIIERPRWRSVLAYLLLHAGQPISTDRFLAAIWGSRAPATAGTQLQGAVSAIRRAFRQAGAGPLISTQSAGYSIRVEADELDLTAFTSATAAARKAAQSDPGSAVRQLRRGLDLWRGPALADISGAYVDVARARLEEERLAAFELLVSLEADRGNHEEFIPELISLVEAHPLRESLTGHLMRALAHSGRKADALLAYTKLRERLVTELGLEPGPELRRLQLELLQDGPVAPATASTGGRSVADPVDRHPRTTVDSPGFSAGSPGAVPRQLPPASTIFTGRASERERLRAVLLSRPTGSTRATVVALHGPAGVGKSALSLHVAHEAAPAYPDGQLYLDLQGSTPGLRPLSPLEVLNRCLRGLGLRDVEIPAEENEAAACFRSATWGRRLLIVLDNAADLQQVQPVISASPATAVIVTSRVPLDLLETELSLHVDVLSPAEAVTLLSRISGRSAAEHPALNEIADRCDYLPLALCLAGARLAREPDLPAARLATELSDHRIRLDALELDGIGIRSSIRVSYDLLMAGSNPADRVAASAFRALGLLRAPTVEAGVIAAMTCPDNPTLATVALARLARAQLIIPDGDGRYRMHDTIRIVAEECATELMSEAERAEMVTAGLRFYAGCALRADELLRPNRQSLYSRPGHLDLISAELAGMVLRSPDDVSPWLDAELPNLIAAAELAATGGYEAATCCAVWIADGLSWVLRKRGEFHRELALARSALTAAERLGDESLRCRSLLYLGRAQLHLERNDEAAAAFTDSLESSQANGDLHGQLSALNDLGLVALKREDFSVARARFLECAELSVTASPRFRVGAVALHNLSLVQLRFGEWEEAGQALRRSVRLRRKSGDRAGVGGTLILLGMVTCKLGLLDEATQHLREGVSISRETGNRVDCWLGLSALVAVYLRQGRYAEAAATAHRCLATARTIKHPFAEATAHRLLAGALQRTGDGRQAARHARLSEAINALPSYPEDRILNAIVADVCAPAHGEPCDHSPASSAAG